MRKKALYVVMAVVLISLPMIAMAEITTTDPALTTYSDITPTTYSDPSLTTASGPVITPLNGDDNGDTNGDTPTVTSYTTDIKAYGDQTASHSIGTLTVDSTEKTYTEFENNSIEFKGTIDIMKSGPCDGDGCSFSVAQGDFTAGSGYENGYTNATTNIDVTNYTASVDMSSFGGMAVCTTADPAAFGNFNQYQNINQTVTYPNVGTTSYSGSQSLDLYSKGYE